MLTIAGGILAAFFALVVLWLIVTTILDLPVIAVFLALRFFKNK